MSQHDYIIDNALAPAFRADLNAALNAIVSQNSGVTAPPSAYPNMLWYDTTNDLLKMRNEAGSAWITLGTVDQTNNVFNPNFLPATQAEAEAGSNNVKGMTPLRVSQAISALTVSGAVTDYQNFLSSGTWTKPSLTNANALVAIEMWGGGGGGSRTSSTGDNAAGGGGGGYGFRILPALLLGSTVAVTVGSGGTGATSDLTNGGAGGSSSIPSYLSVGGGSGGNSTSSTSSFGGDGAHGSGNFGAGSGASNPSSGGTTGATDGTFWGGGGGGAGTSGADAYFGAGGGAGASSSGGLTGGTSFYLGGLGGYGPAGSTGAGGNGVAPGGGGAGGRGGNGGTGGAGRVRIWTIG